MHYSQCFHGRWHKLGRRTIDFFFLHTWTQRRANKYSGGKNGLQEWTVYCSGSQTSRHRWQLDLLTSHSGTFWKTCSFFFRCINTHNNVCHVKTRTQKISSPCSYQANVYVNCTECSVSKLAWYQRLVPQNCWLVYTQIYFTFVSSQCICWIFQVIYFSF